MRDPSSQKEKKRKSSEKREKIVCVNNLSAGPLRLSDAAFVLGRNDVNGAFPAIVFKRPFAEKIACIVHAVRLTWYRRNCRWTMARMR